MRPANTIRHSVKADGFFYRDRHNRTVASARGILRILQSGLMPKTVVDFGCGVGTWLSVCREFGAESILGIDGSHISEADLVIPRTAFMVADLQSPIQLNKTYDLVISCEAAEHLQASSAEVFVNTLAHAGPVILFSGAVPGQGGYKHINEQWPSYWISRFAIHGYQVFDFIRPLIWNDADIMPWYRQNVMLFVAENAVEMLPATWRSEASNLQGLPIVHPEIFACYRYSSNPDRTMDISGRIAMRALTKAILRRFRIS